MKRIAGSWYSGASKWLIKFNKKFWKYPVGAQFIGAPPIYR
jgi:hypothetical protein